MESYQEVNPAKEESVRISRISSENTLVKAIYACHIFVQIDVPELRSVLKIILVGLGVRRHQPDRGGDADQASKT